MSDPVTFLRDTYPELFARGIAQLRERTEAGDEAAKRALEDATGAEGELFLDLGSEGSVRLRFQDGEVRPVDQSEQSGARVAMAVPVAAMRAAVDELERELGRDRDAVALRMASSVSRRAQDAVGDRTLAFDASITGVPELGDVSLRVGFGFPEPPDEPTFSVHLRYEDLEAVREGELGPQQLVTSGRMRFAGDYGPALQVAMQVAQALQPPRQPRRN
jgi:hypothetical protein